LLKVPDLKQVMTGKEDDEEVKIELVHDSYFSDIRKTGMKALT